MGTSRLTQRNLGFHLSASFLCRKPQFNEPPEGLRPRRQVFLRTSTTRLRVSCPTSRTSEHSRAGARGCDVRMFGCSDVYRRMGRTRRRSACRTADVLALKSHNLDATTFLVRAPNFGDPAQRHRRFCASSSRAVRGKWYALAEARGRVVYPLHLTPPLRCCPAPTGRIGNGVGYGPKKAFVRGSRLKQFPAYLNRWDSQQARNEGVFAH